MAAKRRQWISLSQIRRTYWATGSRRTDYPSMDEHNWSIPTDKYKSSYFYDCVNSFQANAIRVRLVSLKPQSSITPHIDYPVTYAVRIIVPIQTNEECYNYFWYRGQKIKYHLKANGHPYFINVAFRHSVVNMGDNSRICLMFSLATPEDIYQIPIPQNIETINSNGVIVE